MEFYQFMIDFNVFSDLKDIQLSEFSNKPTSLTHDQVEASKELWSSADGRVKAGVWECTEGQFTADRTKIAEYCHIISGSALVENEDDKTQREIKSGDLLILPIGWKGKWTILTHMRKLYILSES
jgi:uncharacterized cupin superfamily protein